MISLLSVVVCPLSIVDNWNSELKKFAPHLQSLQYFGDKEKRTEIRKTIIDKIVAQPKSKQKDPDLDFHVLITTPELLLSDIEFLGQFKWKYVIVDEGTKKNSFQLNLHSTQTQKQRFYAVQNDARTIEDEPPVVAHRNTR